MHPGKFILAINKIVHFSLTYTLKKDPITRSIGDKVVGICPSKCSNPMDDAPFAESKRNVTWRERRDFLLVILPNPFPINTHPLVGNVS